MVDDLAIAGSWLAKGHRDEHSVGTYGCDIRPWNNAGVWPFNSWQLSRRPLDYIHYGPTTGITSNEAKNKNILIYPNPTSNYLTVSGVSKNDLITVYNYLGQHFIEKKVNNDSGIETFYINELKAGVYFIKINNKLYTSLLFQKL